MDCAAEPHCSRLGEVYADALPEEGRLLAAQTADAAKAAYLDPARQDDESSPAVQLMRKYEVARLAARQHRTGLTCDPGQIYSIVFG